VIWAFIVAAEFRNAAAVFRSVQKRKFPTHFFGFGFYAATK